MYYQLTQDVQLKTVIRFEAIITHLVFVHSLRVRLNTTVKESESSKTESTTRALKPTAEATPALADAAPVVPDPMDGTNTDSATGTDGAAKPVEAPEAPSIAIVKNEKRGQDQIGKINNMVSTDLKIIHQGSDWMKPCESSSRCPSCLALILA